MTDAHQSAAIRVPRIALVDLIFQDADSGLDDQQVSRITVVQDDLYLTGSGAELYYQMAIRQNATASNGTEQALRNDDKWSILDKAGYSLAVLPVKVMGRASGVITLPHITFFSAISFAILYNGSQQQL